MNAESGLIYLGLPRLWIELSTIDQLMCGLSKNDIPEDLRQSSYVYTFADSINNMCFFDCLAMFLNPGKRPDCLGKESKKYFQQLTNNEIKKKDFQGVSSLQVNEYQKVLDITINIYDYGESKEDIVPSVISSYESETCKTMNLLQYKEHFMLIKNESKEKLMGKFICDKCQTSFTRMRNLNDHQKDQKCRGIHYELKEKFPKYCTNLKASLFGLYMKLVKYNLEKKYDTLMTHLFTYDFESSTDRSNTKNCKKLFFEGQQVPMSFAYAYDLGYGLVSKTVLITDEEINNCPFKLVEVFEQSN